MEEKKDILWRIYISYGFLVLFGIAIIGRALYIQNAEGEKWRSKAQTLTTAYKEIEAVRGNIFAVDGSLIATSVPIYDIRMDVNADPITDEIFNENVDSLAYCLSNLFKDKSQTQYAKELRRARKKGERYHLIKSKVRFNELKALRKFPIFRKGKYKGGLIYIQNNRREMPFRELAARTIGYERDGIKPVGIEGAYNSLLKGQGGKRLMQRIAGDVWMPINDENEIEPEDGRDLYTTIDVNIQDVAHDALLNQLKAQNADHGCLALMEVSTGEIRAIVNLTRTDSGQYREVYNYVIGECTEPGSTFKLASLMVAMEDGYVDLDDTVDTEGGVKRYYDRIMKDSHEGGYGRISVKKCFEVSTNVGVSKIITKYYSKDPKKYIDRLHKMHLGMPLDLEIAGEGKPRIKTPAAKDWSGVTLPWMSIGYESRMSPLHILTFYNAVANNGKLVKPQFVKAISKRGMIERTFTPVVINESIASKETISKARKMLEGVVENGTAKNLSNANYKIAGKTGTAQIANDKYGYKYNGKVSYQASFCGYFPADNPKYSCIIVINAPSNNVYYGNAVAGPIFREVADKVYSTSLDIHKPFQKDTAITGQYLPFVKAGSTDEILKVLNDLKIPAAGVKQAEWTKSITTEKTVQLNPISVESATVPNVTGLAPSDAIAILENKGVQVIVKGKGAVQKQSIPPGTRVEKGTRVILELGLI